MSIFKFGKTVNKNEGDIHNGDNNYHMHMSAEKPLPKIVTIDSAPPPAAHFVGRETELANIKKHIKQNVKLVLVNGMGGIGKSEICKKLFHEFNETDGVIKHIGWIVFDENMKKTLYGKFGATCEITDLEENFKQTKRHINELSTSLLLFIDNMNDISETDKLELDALACNIILTSRQTTHHGNITTVPIGELPEEDCIDIYKELCDRTSHEDEIIRQIVRRAARLTIVVTLLAKTAKRANLTDATLLEKLNKNGFDLSEIRQTVDKKKFNEHLSLLFDLSEISDEERSVLQQFALFPPQPLAFAYAEQWFEQDSPDILNDLADKAWLIKTDMGFYMHQVISDVVLCEAKPTYLECAELVGMIGNDLDFDETDVFTSRLPILPFGESVAQYFMQEENEAIAYLLHNIARLHEYQGDYPTALEWYHKALDIREKVLDTEHPHTATSYNNIATVYHKQGDYPTALEWYYKALDIREKVLDTEHPSTATSYNNIAAVYHKQDDYPTALEWYYKALDIYEKVLGTEHPDTATSYNNIAGVYHNQGNYPKALKWYQKALVVLEKILDKEHPHTKIASNNMELLRKELDEQLDKGGQPHE
ncbi:MAG: tetratricopeptide repeat protein [Oscillospiraceae bacterium]|nr:tetratricopeptide repeat protein [Oscillospiraceae bacterium]